MSRALRRLADRGLLTRYDGAGARLTKAGHQEAAALADTSTATMPSSGTSCLTTLSQAASGNT